MHRWHTTGNCGFANSPELSHQPRPGLLVKKIFPNRKTPLLGKNSSPTVQNPRTDGKDRLLAKRFFPNSYPVGKETLLAKPRRGQTVPMLSASPTTSPLGCWQREQPFANRTTMLLEKGLLSQQPYSVVDEDCSLPTACACCWERIFIFFRILNSNFFGSLATLFTSTWLNVGPFCNIYLYFVNYFRSLEFSGIIQI
jgi:hypothetical protein